MKKVLSIILAVIMIATFVPTAFAEGGCKHEFDAFTVMREGYASCGKCGIRSADFTECFKSYIKFAGMGYSVAFSKSDNESALSRIRRDVEGYDIFKVHNATHEEQGYVDEVAKAVNEYVEDLKKEYAVLFDGTDLIFASFKIGTLELNESQMEIFSDTILEEAEQAFDYYTNGVDEIRFDETDKIEECIEQGKKATYHWTSIISCLEGNHQCVTYTDNGNGTHSSACTYCNTKEIVFDHEWGEYVKAEDGTKTAKCLYCKATYIDNFESNIREFFELLIKLIESFIEAVFR